MNFLKYLHVYLYSTYAQGCLCFCGDAVCHYIRIETITILKDSSKYKCPENFCSRGEAARSKEREALCLVMAQTVR